MLYAKPDKPLTEHMYETGVMAKIMLTESAYKDTTELMMTQTSCRNKAEFVSTTCFLIAIHDIGKVSKYFQNKILHNMHNGFRHEDYSRVILMQYFRKHNITYMNRLCEVIGDHHQCKPYDGVSKILEYPKDESAINQITEQFEELFPPTAFRLTGQENLFCQLFSGLLRFCDWSASSIAAEHPELNSKSDTYKDDVEQLCLKYLGSEHLMQAHERAKPSYHDLFEYLTENNLHPLQKQMENVLAEHPDAQCILIEDQPGSGKTEAALYGALHLMANHHKQGLYFALPTYATAEAMLPRLESLQKRGFFINNNLRLMAGASWMQQSDEDTDEKYAWASRGAQKLFSTFSCGTVDQLMASAEILKSSDMRLYALSNKAVIIDEYHAYDAYMSNILTTLLMWLKAMHVPVIVLSATLQNSARQEIFQIFDADYHVTSASYPRVTVADRSGVAVYTSEAAEKKTYDIAIDSEENAADKILVSTESGGNTLCITNTVRKAYRLYQKIAEKCDDNISLTLYTARTTPANKDAIGNRLVYLYGPKGKADGKRPKRSIVIATQICEMSMDVDFDTVFSYLAPVDSLIQRIGRMRRHDDKGTVRENGFRSVFHLVIPARSRCWERPYEEEVLTGTEEVMWNVVQGTGTIKMPDDIPSLIEQTYALTGEEYAQHELALKAKSMHLLISQPDEKYRVNHGLMPNPVTRDSDQKQVEIICVDDIDHVTVSSSMIRHHMYRIPDYATDDLLTNPVHSKVYSFLLVQDDPSYHGPDDIFLPGVVA